MPLWTYVWTAILGGLGLWGVVFHRTVGAYLLVPAALSDPASVTLTQLNFACAVRLAAGAWLLVHASLNFVAMILRGLPLPATLDA